MSLSKYDSDDDHFLGKISPYSGVTTDPADPAMRGARGPMGAQNYGINFFYSKFNTAILCRRALK